MCILHNVCLMRGDERHMEINEETINSIENNVENVRDTTHAEGQYSILLHNIF